MKNSLLKKIYRKRFEVSIFLISFLSFGALISFQMLILGDYINYQEVPMNKVILSISFWILFASCFTIFTIQQANHRYKDPIEKFAQATEKVANGDFSVYVAPRQVTPDRQDFLDKIFEDFNKMVEELGSIETLKTDFFSNVSHEIKTPLAAVQNSAEMLQQDGLTEAQRKEYALNIMQSTRRLSELITNILRLNKLEKQAIRPVPSTYDLCEQLCNCALQLESVWEKKNIEFIAEIEDRTIIEADESLLEIVWNNLLSNAIKFSGPNGRVILTQTSTADEIFVSVSDTGCGMDEETQKHIFDKFYQGDTSHSTEGNGLGLALVLRILQLMEGTISVDSALDKGTTFTVQIPLQSPVNDTNRGDQSE